MILPLNTIWHGDSLTLLKTLPDRCVDLIFADPPYNLQLQSELIRPNQSVVDAVTDSWDKFDDFASYDTFTRAWLTECRRVLKDSGAIWVIGSYHNIYRVGAILMDLGYWILNDVVWEKPNPMPNFRGTRFTNATETLIWAKKSQHQKKYTFNYHALKAFNDDKQMPNVWRIPICSGAERIKIDGKKAHSTQKPEALLHRVILSSTNKGDVILDPFFGSGTTGAVAKRLGRHFIGLEREARYVQVASTRINAVSPAPLAALTMPASRRDEARVKFSSLLEARYVEIGQLVYSPDKQHQAMIMADSRLQSGDFSGSIHKVAAHLKGVSAFNGWEYWYVQTDDGEFISIDVLRERYRREFTPQMPKAR